MTAAESMATSEEAAPSGRICANCSAVLQGRYCHACGQSADDHKRSIGHLAWEAVEGLFHLDGRLAGTLPALFFRPGRLARDYMEGRVARHVPPFRLFLIALLAFILCAEVAARRNTLDQERQKEARAVALTTPQGRAAEAAKIRAEAGQSRAEDLKDAANDRLDDLKDPEENRSRIEARYARQVGKAQARYAAELAHADRVVQGLPEPPAPAADKSGSWQRIARRRAAENPDYYWTVLFAWGHRLAVLLLPVVGLALALVYRRRREIFLYDHLLVAMDLMSFTFLVNAPAFLLPSPWMFYWLGAAALWTPVNLFQTLRGGYGSSLAGAALKTLAVWLMSVVAFSVMIFALMMWSLAQLA